MYGSSGYGKNSYASIEEAIEIIRIQPSVLPINATLNSPLVETEEIVNFLGITATLHAPSVTTTDREIIIKVNSVDISDQVAFSSLTVNNNLYSDPDTASFKVVKSSNKAYSPSAGDEVEVIDTGVTIFKGLLIRQVNDMVGFSEAYTLEFKDWTEELGSILVDNVYNNETVEDIIADIFTDGDLSNYDGTTNVSDTTNVTRITFDNIPVTECLDRLADLSDKHWYVDPEKDIYFFDDNDIQAPFDLTDENGSYDYSSLIIEEDLTQIRNRVIVKGKGVAAVTVNDATSQSTHGLREFFIRNDEITATNEATQNANAILAAYKDPIKIVTFKTKTNGFYSGQEIDIDSTLRGINETLNIDKVDFIAEAPNRFFYNVVATSQRRGGIGELFNAQTNEPDNTPVTGDQGNLQDIEFTAIDDETIQWSSGTITTSDGTQYSISAKASQVLTGDHVIYLDTNVSTTVLQISTTFSDGIGSGKIPLCYATKNAVATKGADIFPVTFGQKIQLDGGVHITDKSIITDNLAANSVTATEISVVELSAISADLGTCTAGTVTGALVQTAATGLRTLMTSSNGLQFYDSATLKGKILADSTYGIIYDTSGSSHFFRSGGTEYAQINNDGLLLPSSHKISFSGGSVLTDQGSKLELDRDFECDGLLPRGSSQDIGAGSGDEWRNAYIDTTVYMSIGGKIEANNATTEYNPGNSGYDCKWESVGNLRMQCNQDGNVTADGSFTGGGADFAEMFESLDGKEIHAGVSVVLIGDKIAEAKNGENPIGVISANPTIVGNASGDDADSEWSGKYLKDDFGNYIVESVEWWDKEGYKIFDKKTKKRKQVEKRSNYSDKEKPPKGAKVKMVKRRKINPEWNKNEKYIPRKNREEWCVVGLLGRVPVRKNQVIGKNWVKIKSLSDHVDEYLVR